MEHNVKIKTYKANLDPKPLAESVKILDRPRDYRAKEEETRVLERFKDLHWQRDNVLAIDGHADRMYALKYQESDILSRQAKERQDVQEHRIKHLEGIKDNIEETRNRFWRTTQLGREITNKEHACSVRSNKPLYKIINDGVPTRF